MTACALVTLGPVLEHRLQAVDDRKMEGSVQALFVAAMRLVVCRAFRHPVVAMRLCGSWFVVAAMRLVVCCCGYAARGLSSFPTSFSISSSALWILF